MWKFVWSSTWQQNIFSVLNVLIVAVAFDWAAFSRIATTTTTETGSKQRPPSWSSAMRLGGRRCALPPNPPPAFLFFKGCLLSRHQNHQHQHQHHPQYPQQPTTTTTGSKQRPPSWSSAMRLGGRRCALPNFQQWSEHSVFRALWRGNVPLAKTVCNFSCRFWAEIRV